jgi:hypothetical protein
MDSLQSLKARLKMDWIAVINMVTLLAWSGTEVEARVGVLLYNTLSKLFIHVRCFTDTDTSDISPSESYQLYMLNSVPVQ